MASRRTSRLQEKSTEISAKEGELEAHQTSEHARLEADLENRKEQIEDKDKADTKVRDDRLAEHIAELQRAREIEREASRKSVER